MVGQVVTKPDGSIGYSSLCETGKEKTFFIKYLGTTREGFLIRTNYTACGTGDWEFVTLFRREGDNLVYVKEFAGGDFGNSTK